MNKTKGFLRVATILSVIWLIGLSPALSQWERFGFKNNVDDFIGWGALPLIIVSRQNLLNLDLPELRDTLAHLVGV